MEIQTVGVIGCGLMGSGIAHACARSGFTTIVREASQPLVDAGKARLAQGLDKEVQRGKLAAEDAEAARSRLSYTTDFADLQACQLVIEAVTEQLDLKRDIFGALDAICGPETVFASNTSSIPIIQIATATQRRERCAGLHFFNPVPAMKLVEVVRSIATSDETIATLRAFGEALGKTVVEAKDTPGFIVNRLLIPYLIDAVRLLESGVATREDIDAGMQLGCGHPMGPLVLSDFVGLDTLLYVAEVMYEEFREPRFAPPVLLKQMVQAGYLGKKSGKGFYDYKK